MKFIDHPYGKAILGYWTVLSCMHQMIGTPPEDLKPLADHVDRLMAYEGDQDIAWMGGEPNFFLFNSQAHPKLETRELCQPTHACSLWLYRCGIPQKVNRNSLHVVMHAAVNSLSADDISSAWKDHSSKIGPSETEAFGLKIVTDDSGVTYLEVA